MKKIILHIGIEKTGSTSIQQALARDREALADNGILYPRLFGSVNHTELAVYAMDDEVNDELRQGELAKAECTISEYRKRLVDQLRLEIEQSACDMLLLSNEHCHSRLLMPSSLERLKALLKDFSPEIEIVAYLRRQDRLAISVHSTRTILGGQGPMLPYVDKHNLNPYFDFHALLMRYHNVFGHDAMRVRLFEDSELVNGNVVVDFYHMIGLPLPAPVLPRLNESISAKQLIFLTNFNKIFPLIEEGQINHMRGPIFNVIANVKKGPPFRPARADAMAFYDNFRESNARVKETHCPNIARNTLFNENFDSYPENSSDMTLTTDETFEFISAIWKYARKLKTP